ncbi:HIT family protein [Butyrivibrio sp. VCB2006]|uniref:HIT family protein n=1 Tax=Butyrivibrio sp. VCB2006 TaxID=1280679 RepID=UPI0004279919|nr:HIT family protein [Butyrivibrio sp. VCB2006]
MSDCIFCKIANGEIPSNTIFENDDFRVILDLGPATKGHALVLPKKHYADLFEIPADTLAEASKVAKEVAATMKKKLGCDGLNLVQNNGSAAGQTVMHFHLHIIPRYVNDGQHILWKPTSPSPEELVEIKNTILG